MCLPATAVLGEVRSGTSDTAGHVDLPVQAGLILCEG